jgi:hypothetical protein
MRIKDAIAPLRHAVQASPVPVNTESKAERVMRALPVPPAGRVVKSGVAAGATVVALATASAVTSAVRRRSEGS